MAGEKGRYYPVIIKDVYFDSVRQASKELKICTKYIHTRCKSKDWENYNYTSWRTKEEKECKICKQIKPLSDFHHKESNRDKRHTECKKCSNARYKKWRQENLDKVRRRALKYNYNMTMEEYNYLFDKQKGKCSICNIHQDKLEKPLSVDHDHKTEKVRGLLCSSCNLGLGYFKDNQEILKKAINYLSI